tara:strand:+ start:172 stop:1071 length:900 start_codon:yes stop_codon:yes gene_type:complete
MRKRTLSQRGCELFNVCYEDTEFVPKKRRNSCLPHIDIRYIYQKLMTSDFDIKLEKHEKKMKNATKKMFGFLESKKRNLIGKLINNAMTNLIIFTLTDGEKPCKLQKVKMNMCFYISLADKLYDKGDHHSAIIIRCAMSSFHIERLGIKLTERQKEIFAKFEKEYGTFLNMHSCHLKKILVNNDYERFYPSLMVLMMHLNKTKEYAKSFESIGKFPKELRNKEKQLEDIAMVYYDKYKNTNEMLLELYNTDPLDHPIMISYGCNTDNKVNEVLHNISCKINGKKGKGLKRTKTEKKKIN